MTNTLIGGREKNRYFQGQLDNMNLITLEDLSKAISNRVGIDLKEARRNAEFVLDVFGFDNRIIDNVLDPEDRQLFYILEEEGMLTTEREETTLYDGREWRTHYWSIQKETILEYAKDKGKKARAALSRKMQLANDMADEAVYDELDENMWVSRKIEE